MKKFLAVISCVLMITAVLIIIPHAIEPDTSGGQKVAQAAYGTPTIDGQIDSAWDNAPSYKIENVYAQDGITESTATFRVLWDENYLYILHEVKDNTMGDADWESKSAGGNLYKRDAISYAFTPDYDRSVTSSRIPPTFWFIIGAYGNTANWDTVPQEVFISEDGGTTKMYGLSYLYEGTTLAGYVIEVKVKLSVRYTDIKMEAGTCIGFDTYTNDNNYLLMSASRNYGCAWSDSTINSYKNNSLKGTIQLVAKGVSIATTAEVTTAAPDTTPAPLTTKAPETTKTPVTTKAPETTKVLVTTAAPDTTEAPQTTAVSTDGGCGSSLGISAVMLAVTTIGSCIILKKKKAK